MTPPRGSGCNRQPTPSQVSVFRGRAPRRESLRRAERYDVSHPDEADTNPPVAEVTAVSRSPPSPRGPVEWDQPVGSGDRSPRGLPGTNMTFSPRNARRPGRSPGLRSVHHRGKGLALWSGITPGQSPLPHGITSSSSPSWHRSWPWGTWSQPSSSPSLQQPCQRSPCRSEWMGHRSKNRHDHGIPQGRT